MCCSSEQRVKIMSKISRLFPCLSGTSQAICTHREEGMKDKSPFSRGD